MCNDNEAPKANELEVSKEMYKNHFKAQPICKIHIYIYISEKFYLHDSINQQFQLSSQNMHIDVTREHTVKYCIVAPGRNLDL